MGVRCQHQLGVRKTPFGLGMLYCTICGLEGDPFPPCPKCGKQAEAFVKKVMLGFSRKGYYACSSCGYEWDFEKP